MKKRILFVLIVLAALLLIGFRYAVVERDDILPEEVRISLERLFGVAQAETEAPAPTGMPDASGQAQPTIAPTVSPVPTPVPTPEPRLERGDSGDEVKTLQERLRELGFMTGSADGKFGPKTEEGVKAFKKHLYRLEQERLEQERLAAEQALAEAQKAADAEAVNGEDAAAGAVDASSNGTAGEDASAGAANASASDVDAAASAPENHTTGKDTVEGVASAGAASTPSNDETAAVNGEDAVAGAENAPSNDETVAAAGKAAAVNGEDAANASANGTAGEDASAGAESTPSNDETAAADAEPEFDGKVDEQTYFLIVEEGFDEYQTKLQQGARGAEVERLQGRLKTLGYLIGKADGIFGKQTANAVVAFQKRHQLAQDGIAGEKTQRALYDSSAKRQVKPVQTKGKPYMLKVSTAKQRVYAYAWSEADKAYTKMARTMVCSTGLASTPTPKGTFSSTTAPVVRWGYFPKYDVWAQYLYRIKGPYLFHSVLYDEADESTVKWGSVNKLGSPASHGCIRLSVEDARWIYNNCPAGTTVTVY